MKSSNVKLILVYVLVCIISTLSCKSSKMPNNPPFEIIEASYFYWNGGQPGVSGININIRYTSLQKVSFDSIYFRNMKGAIEQHQDNKGRFMIGRINTSKTLDVLSVDSNPEDEASEVENSMNLSSQFGLSNEEALILYTFNDTQSYCKVSGLTEKQPKFYK